MKFSFTYVYRRRNLSNGSRKAYRAFVSIFINAANAEKIIIFRHSFHHEIRHVSGIDGICPDGRSRVAPDDLVACQISVGARVPF